MILSALTPEKQSQRASRWLEAIPAFSITIMIFILCFYWAGYRSSGYALIHLLTMIICTVSILINRRFLKIDRPFRPLLYSYLAFLFYCFLNYVCLGKSSKGVDVLIFLVDLFLLAMILYRTPRRFIGTIHLFWLTGSTVIAVMHIFYALGMHLDITTPSFLTHGFHFGFYALLMVFSSLGYILGNYSAWSRYIALSACLSGLTFVILDFKSSALPGLVAGFVLLVVFYSRLLKRHYQVFLIALFLLPVLLSFFLIDQTPFTDARKHIENKNIFSARAVPMRTALDAALSSPWIGLGIGNFEYLSGRFEPPGLDRRVIRAHNSYLEVFAEGGFIGIVLISCFMWLLITFLVKNDKHRVVSEKIKSGWIVAVFSTFIPSGIDFGLQMPVNAIALTFMIMLTCIDSRSQAHSGRSKHKNHFDTLIVLSSILTLLAIFPYVAGFKSDKAASLYKKGQIDQAIRSMETAVRTRPLDDRVVADLARYYLAKVSLTGGDPLLKRVDLLLNRSIKLNPINAQNYYLRASAREFRNSPDDWVNQHLDLKLATSLDPSNPYYAMGLVENYLRQGRLEKARETLFAAISRGGDINYQIIVELFADLTTKHPELFESFLESCSFLTDYQKMSFLTYLATRNRDDHVKKLVMTIHEPDVLTWSFEDAEQYLKVTQSVSDTERTLRVTEALLTRHKTPQYQAALLKFKAESLTKLIRYEDALAAYDKAISLDKNNPDLAMRRIDVLMRLKGDQAAYEDLLELVKTFPNHPRFHAALAKLLEARGERLQALYEYRLASSLEGMRTHLHHIKRLEKQLGLSQ